MSEVVIKEEKKIEQEVENVIDKNRVVGFSDAVFAFAATLLVLKIDLPQGVNQMAIENLSSVVFTLWPQYLANIISFLVIGYYWLNHHAIFGLVKRFNSTVVWINLLFLVFLSFIPFPVDLYGEYPTVPFVVMFYSGVLAFVGYFLAFLWWYVSSSHRLISSSMSQRQINYYLARNFLAPVIFTLSIPLVYIDPFIAQLSWIFVIVGSIFINKFFKIKKMSEIDKDTI